MEVGQTGDPTVHATKTAEQEINSPIEAVLILVQVLKGSNARVHPIGLKGIEGMPRYFYYLDCR